MGITVPVPGFVYSYPLNGTGFGGTRANTKEKRKLLKFYNHAESRYL